MNRSRAACITASRLFVAFVAVAIARNEYSFRGESAIGFCELFYKLRELLDLCPEREMVRKVTRFGGREICGPKPTRVDGVELHREEPARRARVDDRRIEAMLANEHLEAVVLRAGEDRNHVRDPRERAGVEVARDDHRRVLLR